MRAPNLLHQDKGRRPLDDKSLMKVRTAVFWWLTFGTSGFTLKVPIINQVH